MAIITIVADEVALAATAAGRVTTLIARAIDERREAAICLTGGDTPERLYSVLVDDREPWRTRIDWGRVHFYWGDERHVPPDHPDSNFGMAYRAMLSRVPVRADHIHRIRGEYGDAEDAASEYDTHLRPFDVTLLGLGEDAHIASIFPHSPLLDGGPSASVAAVFAAHLQRWRITLTPSALLTPPAILVLVSGAKKAAAVRAALTLPEDVTTYPAQLLRRAGDRVEWIIDRAAAGEQTPA